MASIITIKVMIENLLFLTFFYDKIYTIDISKLVFPLLHEMKKVINSLTKRKSNRKNNETKKYWK